MFPVVVIVVAIVFVVALVVFSRMRRGTFPPARNEVQELIWRFPQSRFRWTPRPISTSTIIMMDKPPNTEVPATTITQHPA